MDCENCIHQTACSDWCRGFGQEAELCEHFSDKAEWEHLPCKVGTQVFFLRDKTIIIETNVEKITFKGNGCYIKLECNAMYETSCQSIGKTVFFTRKEAEKALETRRKNK
mgnify:CR=1 FL=1